MNKTSIEWVRNPDGTQGFTWNPITGCLNHVNGMCKGGNFSCYAYKLANGRLKKRYLENEFECLNADLKNPFAPRFWFSKLEQPKMVKKPSGIFACDMGELFGSWLEDDQCDVWQTAIFRVINECPQHRFYLLTKQPQNLINFSPFPKHCWVGATLTLKVDDYGKQMGMNSFATLACLKEVKTTIKFISFEPLLGQLGEGFKPIWWAEQFKEVGINWIIIGGQTKPYKPPKLEWVQEIEDAADKVNIPIFEKDNLVPLFTENEITTGLRQEFPNEK